MSTEYEMKREAAIRALLEAAKDITPDGDPEDCTTIYDPYDVAEWLTARARGLQ